MSFWKKLFGEAKEGTPVDNAETSLDTSTEESAETADVSEKNTNDDSDNTENVE